ncbi:MAG: NAD(P)H-dependent oxidoreductase, partial [Bacteroidales bacterium]|nr:NAD(P)H-dependent oxidoreductase [Bacteroidales bacterium]
MKKINLIIAIATVTLAAVSCKTNNEQKEAEKQEAPKILVTYYSQTSNTKAVAEEIAKKLGADIEEIVAVNPYDGDFNATIERGRQELEEGILPEIKPITADISKYDVVFIGFPVWFGTYAPPISTFLENADLSGKKIVPFCTFGSGGLESSTADLAKAEPKAEILPGYGVRAARLDAMPKEVDNFLKA